MTLVTHRDIKKHHVCSETIDQLKDCGIFLNYIYMAQNHKVRKDIFGSIDAS